MAAAIPNGEAVVATVNIASELTSGRMEYRTELSHNLRVSKAFKEARVSITFCGLDFRCKFVNGVVRSIEWWMDLAWKLQN
jgi:hypothetical protein